MEKGFAELTEAIKKLTSGISVFRKVIESSFLNIGARLQQIEYDVSDVPMVREEINELEQRIRFLERKVGASK